MVSTPDLGIPELAQSQANPDVTHNRALVVFQALLNGVIDKDLTAPPGSPTEGDAYLINTAAPTGAWAGRGFCIAIYWAAAWYFVPGENDAGTPITMGSRQEGLSVYVRDENAFYVWRNTATSPASYDWVSEGAGPFVQRAGDTMTGALSIGPIASGFALTAQKGNTLVDPAWNANVDIALFEGIAGQNVAVQNFCDAGFSAIYAFSSPTARNRGGVSYNHATDTLALTVAGATGMVVTATGSYIGAATGAQQGVNTLNAANYFDDGVNINLIYASLALANTFTQAQTINLNAATAPSPVTGTVVHYVQADAVPMRISADSFGIACNNTSRRANGTAAAPTALLSGETIGNFNGYGYGATGYSATARASMGLVTTENWTDTAQGCRFNWNTTPNGSTTATSRWGIDQDGTFLYAGGTVTGAGTINAVDYFDNGVNINTIYAGLAAANIFTNAGTNQFTNNSTAVTGVGTVHVVGADAANTQLAISAFGGIGTMNGRRANTSAAAPSALASADVAFQFGALGYGATGFSSVARAGIRFTAAEAWTDTAQGMRVQFRSTAIGGTGTGNRWDVGDDGSFHASSLAVTGNGTVNANSFWVGGTGVIDANRAHLLRVYTVATLPAAGTAGRLAAVSDALAPAYGAAIAGGGAVNTPVYDTGAGWTAH